MANVSKIKLPDNSTLDIIDSRISSVDSSISSSSSGVVTNSTIAAEFDKVAYIGDTIDSATYTDSGIVIDVSNKADKVTNATSGNFAALDANGNLTDSGHKSSDYQTTLISGTNIKTINNESLLGSGNITIGAGGSGTVTSVGITVPTGLSVSGSPITSNGTLAVSLASGYEIPQSNAIVHKAGTETITGDKTFVGVQTFDDCVVNLDSGSELNNLTATDFSWLTTNDGSGSYKTLQSELNNKQDALVSGTNIKTINNTSLLGSGNISIPSVWESGTGTTSVKVIDSLGTADGNYSTVEGKGCVTGGSYTENNLILDTADTSSGSYSHAEGRYTIACGAAGSHAEGNRTLASGNMSHAENNQNIASGASSHAEGYNNRAIGGSSHVEGQSSVSIGSSSHAETAFSNAVGNYSHAEIGNAFVTVSVTGAGNATTYTVVISDGDFINLYNSVGSTVFENIIGHSRIALSGSAGSTITQITQVNSISFQNNVITISLDVEKTLSSTALSNDTTYRMNCTMSYGENSHSEASISYGNISHAEGRYTVAVSQNSHTEGRFTITKNDGEHAEGWFNVSNKASDTYGNAGNTQHSIGIGSASARKNAVEVMQNGDVYVYGVGGYDGTNYSSATTLQSAISNGGGGSGDTSSCVHKTGDETVGGDKTFTDDIIVGDASNIKYGASSGSAGFTKGYAVGVGGQATLQFSVLGEPKAFVVTAQGYGDGVLAIIGDSTGCRGIYAAASTYQHNFSTGFSSSYSGGILTITPPSGVTFIEEDYSIVYYYGSGTLTFKSSTVTPGSGVTAVTFTGTGLTEIPAMYACLLETQVNSEQYRRVALYTNSSWWTDYKSLGLTFFSQQVSDTTSSFSASYNNGLYINSGGTNAGGYFHNPGTYTLYYLMASDIGGGGGGNYNSLKDELDGIRNTISGIETLLAAI